MNARSVILVLAALLIAAGTAFFARNWLTAERSQRETVAAPPPPAHSVLVAKANLPAGTFIREDNVRWQAWPGDSLDANYLLKDAFDPASLVGAVVRRGIVAGEPVTAARVAKPGDRGFLAAVLKPGMRAVSVAIDATSGISGLIFPGDRVDLLLTHVVGGGGEGGGGIRASETVLENVRLVAIDQKVNDQEKEPDVGRTVTIEVTPKQAEMIAVLVDLGRMSLSLRSLGLPEEGAEGAMLAAAEPIVATDAVPENPGRPLDEEPEPVRGETFTLQNEVSHLLARRAQARKVLVVQGSNSELITVGE